MYGKGIGQLLNQPLKRFICCFLTLARLERLLMGHLLQKVEDRFGICIIEFRRFFQKTLHDEPYNGFVNSLSGCNDPAAVSLDELAVKIGISRFKASQDNQSLAFKNTHAIDALLSKGLQIIKQLAIIVGGGDQDVIYPGSVGWHVDPRQV